MSDPNLNEKEIRGNLVKNGEKRNREELCIALPNIPEKHIKLLHKSK